MAESSADFFAHTSPAVIYAGDYLNKLSGERIERECRDRLQSGCRAMVISFRDTELVNSIGISILLGIIDAAETTGAKLLFSDVNSHTAELFQMLGLTRHVEIVGTEADAFSVLKIASKATGSGH